MKQFNLFKAFGHVIKVIALICACIGVAHGFNLVHQAPRDSADDILLAIATFIVVVLVGAAFIYLLFWFWEEEAEAKESILEKEVKSELREIPPINQEGGPVVVKDYNDSVRISKLQKKGYRIYEQVK